VNSVLGIRTVKMTRHLRLALASLVVTSTLIAFDGGLASLPTASAAGSKLPKCPTAALQSAKSPVTINFWESMTQQNAATLTTLTDQFNASQDKVHVNLVAQADYNTTWQQYQNALSTGGLPAVAQLQDTNLQEVIDTRSILPVQSCINATHYETSDFLSRALAYWRVGGVQMGMPFAVSNPVFLYNKNSFTAAGLNPDDPPKTLADMVSDAQALKAHGIGTALVLDSWHLETWLSTANTAFVNNGNGRNARATKAVFASTAAAKKVFTELDTLVRQDGAATNPSSGPDAFDNLLGIGSGKYGMTIDTTAVLGTVFSLLHEYPNVSLGVAPFPVLSANVQGGIEPGGSALYISNRVPVAQQAAAWEYIQFLDSTNSQATWSAGTGYIPLRKSSVQTSTIQTLWSAQPAFKVAYEQLLSGRTTAATAGAVIGPYDSVRTTMLDAEESMFQQGTSPSAALRSASGQIDSILASYNQRLGS
jgi:sn-glycerol 3-phosphate transport system substrate-binding protein